jgi:hypothetical protein
MERGISAGGEVPDPQMGIDERDGERVRPAGGGVTQGLGRAVHTRIGIST